MKKKIISVILAITIFATSFHRLGIVVSYADKENITNISEDLIYNPNQKSALVLSGLVSTYAVPVAISIATIGVIGLGISETLKPEDVRTLLNGMRNAETHHKEVNSYFTEKIMKFHAGTVGYLILAGAYNSDTLSEVEEDMEESGWTPQFIQSVKDDLGGGSSGDGGDQEPKGKIDWKSLVKYGASALVGSAFLGGLWTLIKEVLPSTPNATDGTFPVVGNPSYQNGSFRWVDLPFKSTGKYTANNAFRMMRSPDLNMDLVQQVSIQMSDITYYNYGWDGVVYSQEYLLNSVDGKQFIFLLMIGKALSPNQYSDLEHDGLAYMFYELNSDMTAKLDSEHNFYNDRIDTTRLSIDAKMTSIRNRLGFKIGNTFTMTRLGSSNDQFAFKTMRSKIQKALGADLFPQISEDTTFNPYSALKTSIADLSKGIQGVYNNKWQLIEGSSVFPSFDTNAFEIYFPQSIPTGTGNIYKDKDLIKEQVGDSANPGSVITRPSKDQTVSTPTVENIFNPSKPGQTETVNPSTDIPGTDELDKVFPDISVPGLDTDTDNPGDTDTDNPGDTDTDNPPTTQPGFPDFGDIPKVKLDLTPLRNGLGKLTERFPFSLPWDLQRIAQSFGGQPNALAIGQAPVVNMNFNGHELVLDFAKFEPIAMILRGFIFTEVAIGLIFVLRKLKP